MAIYLLARLTPPPPLKHFLSLFLPLNGKFASVWGFIVKMRHRTKGGKRSKMNGLGTNKEKCEY